MTSEKVQRTLSEGWGTLTDGAEAPMVMLPYRSGRRRVQTGVLMGMLPHWIGRVMGPSRGPYGGVALQNRR